MQKYGGFLNARKPSIVAQKDFKVHQLSVSPKEMDFTESRKYLIQMAHEHFCVPPEMRGNLQNSNRATIDSAFYLWTKNVVTKRLRLFASTINNQFVPMFDKAIIWKFDDIVPEDNDFKMKLADAGLAAGTITRNEWRKIATSCGVTFLPDEQRGDVYLTGLMIQEVPAFKEPVKAIEPTEPDDTPPLPPEPPSSEKATPEKAIDLDLVIKELNEMNDRMTSKYKGAMESKSFYNDDQKIAIWKAFDSKATAFEPIFENAVKKFAGLQGDRVKSAVKSVTNEKTLNVAIDSVFNGETDSALKRALAPGWIASMKGGRDNAKLLLTKKKVADTDTVTNDWFNKWIDKAGLLKAKEINDTTHEDLLKKLQEVMSESIATGDGLSETIKKILAATDDVYENMSESRAALIARTESASTVNYGSYATYKVEGVEKKEWLATRDGRTRDAHASSSLEGNPIGIDEKFSVGIDMMEFPGDPSASAGNVCNCRCTIMPVL
jgi:hypothetical protein